LYRVGVKYVSALDRFVDEQERTWQPESNTNIDERLFLNYWKINCLRVS
jgi:hypothetical protein